MATGLLGLQVSVSVTDHRQLIYISELPIFFSNVDAIVKGEILNLEKSGAYSFDML